MNLDTTFRIGVMGAASGKITTAQKKLAFKIGEAIAKAGCLLITGGTSGLPFEAARGAKSANGKVVGISPAGDVTEHVKVYKKPTENHDFIVFTGLGLSGRNPLNIRNSDALIFISGSFGTLNELALACDSGKPIGIMAGSGGIADQIPALFKTFVRQPKNKIVSDRDPQKLVTKILKTLK